MPRDPGASYASEAAHRTPPGSSALRESEAAAAMFYLCESAASATNVFCSESAASATKHPAGTEINHSFYRKSHTLFNMTP
ncbi:hypothetical protein [Lysinibacillus sp. Bpr_S20]|uniref:hypothetical protein n=1 Tax=Lysinibacillus sp. Bpr_S20 TaxID=2933964 RepID=UPI00201206F0|nr:hypothetical protein [Lysinibacillus sp. Bpr_S20]MCL1701100.1 hypothetical protein [Lysinibacillus sp. Bpr_S20]